MSIEKRTADHWSDRVSMTAVLFLLLGLWAVTWEAVASLAWPCCSSALNQPQGPLSHQRLTSSRSWRVRKGQPGFNRSGVPT